MKRTLLLFMILVSSGCASAQDPVRYVVDLPAPQTQMIEMTVVFPEVPAGDVDVQLPAWRPGRYEILDPAGTVREVQAEGGDAVALPVRKIDKGTWRITTEQAGVVRVRYRVYANSIGDRTRHVDASHAFLSPSTVFMYVPALRDVPVEVSVRAPDDWNVATGLDARMDGTIVAPNYDVLVDSPLEIGLHDVIVFEAAGRPHEIVIWPPGVALDRERVVEDFTTIIESCVAVFGRVPYDRYVFLVHVGAGGGGTEHLNSTIMQTSRSSFDGSFEGDRAYHRFLGLVAHEFFHTWNVKQLRPAGIHPYDYQHENYTPLLWVAEGTTSYYDELLLARTDLMKRKRYFDRLADAIGSERVRPGARVQSLEASSFDAWIKYNATTPDSVNSTVSFYGQGALASLALDMEILRATNGEAGLDDVMRALYEAFPLDGPGYTTEDFVRISTDIAGADLSWFFERHVAATDPMPFEAALAVVGLDLYFDPARDDEDDEEADEEDGDEEEGQDESDVEASDDADRPTGVEAASARPYLGLDLRSDGGRTVVRAVRSDGPAYAAGVIAGDEIVALDGRRLGASELDTRLERREPGEDVTLHLMRRNELMTIDVALAGRPDGKWKIRRVKEPTDAQRRAFEAWLGPWDPDASDEPVPQETDPTQETGPTPE